MTENEEFRSYLVRLYPLLRSLTGEGVRLTHRILGEILPLETLEIASGTPVLDWIVPLEWSVRSAFIIGPDGRRILDVANHPLHLVNYSQPFSGVVDREELDRHLHSLPDRPQVTPYVTSYYAPRWGFCLSHAQRMALPEGRYEVVIDTALTGGSMTLSHAVISGDTPAEVLISTYTCHPALANDEISAPIAMALLARRIAKWPRRHLTYRFVFAPETIGSIAYLAKFGDHLRSKMVAGYAVSNIGHDLGFRLKRSRRETSLADRAAAHVLLSHYNAGLQITNFLPTGSDERQFCSPGFNLPVARLIRGEAPFPTYHTSDDKPEAISDRAVIETIDCVERICMTLDGNRSMTNLKPFGEPHLSKYGLYPTLGSTTKRDVHVEAMMWVLAYGDGDHDLLDIAERSGIPFADIEDAAKQCAKAGVIAERSR